MKIKKINYETQFSTNPILKNKINKKILKIIIIRIITELEKKNKIKSHPRELGTETNEKRKKRMAY
jgi:hypothetical protein